MFLELAAVLTVDEVDQLRALADRARFADGRITSPYSTTKNNLQIDQTDPAYADSSKVMAEALHRNELFRNFAFPRIITSPMLARYVPGMKYGAHSDAPFLAVGQRPLRSDLSCTIFLVDPESFEGGELSIHLGTRAVCFKGAAGSAVIYPSNTLHEVKPVTSGERLVGLTFIESFIRDPANREMLYQLNEVAALEGFNMSWDNRTRLQCVRDNLRRIWGEAG